MLEDIVPQYIRKNPREAMSLALLIDQLATGQKLNDRRNWNGHIAGSGIVLSRDRSQILLIDHKSFKRWQQPGGHWESDEDKNPLEVARREVTEETGVQELEYLPIDPAQPLVPLDISTHSIKARPEKDEPDHWHHDFRYVFIAGDEPLKHQESEVNGVRWFALDAPEVGPFVGKSVQKLRDLGIIS